MEFERQGIREFQGQNSRDARQRIELNEYQEDFNGRRTKILIWKPRLGLQRLDLDIGSPIQSIQGYIGKDGQFKTTTVTGGGGWDGGGPPDEDEPIPLPFDSLDGPNPPIWIPVVSGPGGAVVSDEPVIKVEGAGAMLVTVSGAPTLVEVEKTVTSTDFSLHSFFQVYAAETGVAAASLELKLTDGSAGTATSTTSYVPTPAPAFSQFLFPLSEFGSIDLTDVTKVSLSFVGSAGFWYFDDLQVLP